MHTKYFKNFNQKAFASLQTQIESVASNSSPLWKGTVYIGTKPLYIECHIKWLADKINDYFIVALQDQHIKGAKEIYILNKEVKDFITAPTSIFSDLFFLGDDIFAKPDLIVNDDYILLRTTDKCFLSISENTERHLLYLDENHLLARLFYYIFEPHENMILHSAVVAYGDYGILISGLSGSGKSTLSASCLSLGMDFVADDKVALHIDNGALYADPIYTVLSLKSPIDGIDAFVANQQTDSYKNVFVLDKSLFAKNIKIRAVIEPYKAYLDAPEILRTAKQSVITRICSDYSVFSVLTPNKNPIIDYKNIFNLFCGIDFYKINLSKSIRDNAQAIFDLAKTGGVNVQ